MEEYPCPVVHGCSRVSICKGLLRKRSFSVLPENLASQREILFSVGGQEVLLSAVTVDL